MFLLDYSNFIAPATNDDTFQRSHTRMIDDAISGIIANGSFNYAECSVTESIWTVGMATDYLVSKAIGFIDLNAQELLRQNLFNIIKLNIHC